MKSGFVVVAEEMVDTGQFQPHPGQVRPLRKDRLEPSCGLSRMTESRRDQAEQKQTLDALLSVYGSCLLKQLASVVQPPDLEEELSGLHVRDFNTFGLDVLCIAWRGTENEQGRDYNGDDGEGSQFQISIPRSDSCQRDPATAFRPRKIRSAACWRLCLPLRRHRLPPSHQGRKMRHSPNRCCSGPRRPSPTGRRRIFRCRQSYR